MGGVITKDIPPYEIWAGNPTRFIRKRVSDDIIDKIIKSEWWNLDDTKLKEVSVHFKYIEKTLNTFFKMKILHLMLSNFYIDNAGYQENILPAINKKDGHNVEIIASTEIFTKNIGLGLTHPSIYVNTDGIKITRLPYVKILNNFISKKVRAYPKLYNKIEEFAPDIILFHGAAAWSLNTVAKYKKNNPHVKLYVDSHEDKNNSARNGLSRILLYDCFYSPILRKNMKYIDKLFYITKETLYFIKEVYHLNDEKLHFLPLGGIIPGEEKRSHVRETLRKEYGLSETDILCIHSGKIDRFKRTFEIVEGFSRYKSDKFKLLIVGSASENILKKLDKVLQKDNRIKFLGWKNQDDLQNLLMAADLYIQLGTQSVTMQQAICNGCSVAVYPYESHKFLLNDNAYYIQSSQDITSLLESIDNNVENFKIRREKSLNFAQTKLDYNIIANEAIQ